MTGWPVRLPLAAVNLSALLGSCMRGSSIVAPPPVSFTDHPGILRGAWPGAVPDGAAGQALTLTLTATPDTPARYAVQGSGRLAGDTLTVAGSVGGGSDRTYLRPQTSPIQETATLTLGRAGQPDTTLRCTAYRTQTPDAWLWNCQLASQPTTFTLSKGMP